jgi:hypothetical protein
VNLGFDLHSRRQIDPFVFDTELFAAALRSTGLPETAREPPSAESRIAASFIEAYFSNCIEGTRFVVEEAKKIVFDGVVPVQRSQDGHDLLATYRQLANLGTHAPSTISTKDFEQEIKARHADLMSDQNFAAWYQSA